MATEQAADNWAHAFAYTCANEGSTYVEDPTPTLRGVTLATLSAWRKTPCAAADIKALSLAETQAIYKSLYWQPMALDNLTDAAVTTVLFDISVNCGTARAAKLVQTCFGLVADGAVGPKTVAAMASALPATLVPQLVASQHAYYLSLVIAAPARKIYHATWQKRCALYMTLLAP